jgi:3-deoxy-D-manno-octulosonic-acid transferase
VGPHTENFRDIIGIFRRANAVKITRPEAFPETLLELLAAENERQALGSRAKAIVGQQMGATERTLVALRRLMEESAR